MPDKNLPENIKNIFEFYVEGQYIFVIDGRQTTRSYKEAFRLPAVECALSVIQNKLILKRLQNKYDGVVGFQTCGLIDFEQLKGVRKINLSDSNVRLMNREELKSYVDARDLPVDVTIYTSLYEVYIAIETAIEDIEKYASKANALRKERNEDEVLNALNEDIDDVADQVREIDIDDDEVDL